MAECATDRRAVLTCDMTAKKGPEDLGFIRTNSSITIAKH